MSHGIGMPRTLVKKVMLCAVGALALELALAQQQPAEKKVAFEVATIKLAASNAAPKSQMVRPSPNRISIPSMTLNWLIYTATAKG